MRAFERQHELVGGLEALARIQRHRLQYHMVEPESARRSQREGGFGSRPEAPALVGLDLAVTAVGVVSQRTA